MNESELKNIQHLEIIEHTAEHVSDEFNYNGIWDKVSNTMKAKESSVNAVEKKYYKLEDSMSDTYGRLVPLIRNSNTGLEDTITLAPEAYTNAPFCGIGSLAYVENKMGRDRNSACGSLISIQERMLDSMMGEIETLAEQKPELFSELISQIKGVQAFVQLNIINTVKANISKLVKEEKYLELDSSIKSLNNFELFKHYFGDLEMAMTLRIERKETERKEAEQYQRNDQIISLMEKSNSSYSNKWVRMIDIDVANGAGMKFTRFKYDLGDCSIIYDGEIAVPAEREIKSGKDLTIEALRIALLLGREDFKRLTGDATELAKAWGRSNTTKPSTRVGDMKAPYELEPGIYIETGFGWERRVQYIKKVYELLELDAKDILVQVRENTGDGIADTK